MRLRIILFITVALLASYAVYSTFQISQLKSSLSSKEKELRTTKSKLDDAEYELHELNSKIEQYDAVLMMAATGIQRNKNSMYETKYMVQNLRDAASDLESSIDDLIREINYINCKECKYEILDIENKANAVREDFERLQSNLD